MPDCRVVTQRELKDVVDLDSEAISVIADAFGALATRPVAMPPVLRLDIMAEDRPVPWGEVDVKTAHIPGLDSFAIKVSPGFFNNPAIGLPSLNGLMIVLSAKTGLLEAMLLDNGYLTDLRTAAAGGLAADMLARKDSRHLAILGSGCQARLQARAVALVRPMETITVWGRDGDAARACASDIEGATGIRVATAERVCDAVAQADIVVTTTPSETPLFEASMLRPGMHITAMGSDAENKNEIDPNVLAAATRITCDRRSQCAELGELRQAIATGAIGPDHPTDELGDVIAGKKTIRFRPSDITLCDLTGTGIQDTAIARHALARISKAGLGSVLSV